MALANPIWGVVNYLMAYQTNPTDTWWGQPLYELGVRFSLIAALFTILGLFLGRKNVPTVRPSVSLWEIGVAALIVVAWVNLQIAPNSGDTADYAFEKLWKTLLFTLILGRLATTRTNIKLVLWSLVTGSLYIGYDAYTASPDAFYLGRLERIGGPDFSTTSGTAAHLAAMLPLIGTALLISCSWRGRILSIVAGALSVNAIILCRTRSAFVGVACGAAAALLAAPQAKRFRIHTLLVIGAVTAYSLTDDHFWTRMSTLRDKESLNQDAAAVTRTEIWQLSLRILADHPMGIGPGNFPRVIGTYDERYYKRSSHNTIVVCFTELGFQGGAIFLSLTVMSFWFLYRSARLAAYTSSETETKLLAYGLLVTLVTYYVSGLGTERFYCESYWWVMVLPLGLYRMVLREAAIHLPAPVGSPSEKEDEVLAFIRPAQA